MPHVYTRVFPQSPENVAEALAAAIEELASVFEQVTFHHGPWSAAEEDDEGGWTLSVELPTHDPDLMIREIRQVLGLSKWLALRDPSWWVQVWDDLQLVEATFGRTLALSGGVAVDDEGVYDEGLEMQLAEAVARIPLPGVDLGFPPGVPEEALSAMDEGVADELRSDEGFVRMVVAAIDRCGKLRRTSAAEALASVLDQVDDRVLRPILVHDWAEHAQPARLRLAGILERAGDTAARDTALDLLFSVPKGLALDDAATALIPWAQDEELVATLMAVVEDEDVPPGPGTRVEGACADLLMRSLTGLKSVARRARRDRDADPIAWWAVRKLLEVPADTVLPTIRLYARPGAAVPTWLQEGMAEAGVRPPRDEREVEALLSEEEMRLLA
ncbi:MAG: hypothetical protein H6738_21020 [Alphaproteobacteria bacterium]|nr:hypothetical protein [Alphaproteobacteria bacterium]MCB9699276.1 hypothetical protein [Alphaproteobacteria bacterium]